MDEHLRTLLRLAAAGDQDALAALERRAARLGGSAAEFRLPQELPELVEDYSDPILYSTSKEGIAGWSSGNRPGTRRFFRERANRRTRGRVRRALRSLRPEEWDEY